MFSFFLFLLYFPWPAFDLLLPSVVAHVCHLFCLVFRRFLAPVYGGTEKGVSFCTLVSCAWSARKGFYQFIFMFCCLASSKQPSFPNALRPCYPHGQSYYSSLQFDLTDHYSLVELTITAWFG